MATTPAAPTRTGLLLVHGFPLDARMWREQVAAFGPRLPVVAPDLPGFGQSPEAAHPPSVLTMDDAADATARALDAAGLDDAVVCGCSMGGYIAFAMWRRHQRRVRALVLANTRANADDEAGRERRRALAERVLREGSAVVADSPPPLLAPSAPAALWDEVRALIRQQPPGAIAAASLGMAARPDVTAELGSISVPALVITGSDDTLIAPQLSAGLTARLPAGELQTIAGAGHLACLEAPDAFNAALERFLRHLGLIA